MDPYAALISLLFSVTATWALTEVIHHGSIFEAVRAYAEVSDSFFARLLTCPFCLSHWTALAAVGLAEIAFRTENLAFSVLLWLASVRLANLLNDLTHGLSRTPKDGLMDDFEITEDDEK